MNKIKEFHKFTSKDLDPIDRVVISYGKPLKTHELRSVKEWAYSGSVLVALANADIAARLIMKRIFEGNVR